MGFEPDLGLRYLDSGHGDKTFTFGRARVGGLVQIGPKALTCSTSLPMEVRYALSFDFAGPVVDELIDLAPELADAVRVIINLPFSIPRSIEIPDIRADLECRLGEVQESEKERYVPFVVLGVSSPSASTSIQVSGGDDESPT